jgi:acetyl esterase/lipase
MIDRLTLTSTDQPTRDTGRVERTDRCIGPEQCSDEGADDAKPRWDVHDARTMTRRGLLLGGLGALAVTASACGSAGVTTGAVAAQSGSGRATGGTARARSATAAPSTVATSAPTRHRYGTDESQFGDLYRGSGPQSPGVVVIIHGGFWRDQYDLSLGAPLAGDLAARGYTAFNLEYRRVGNGGGWPNTLLDVAAGIDALATLDVDRSRVVVIGHSAGGQLGVWAAGRSRLPIGAPGHDPRVAVTAVIAQAGVLDLATAQRQGVGGSAESDFLGGNPAQVPARYAVADPIKAVPLPVPVLCVHSRSDRNVPFAQSTAYVAAAKKAGAQATLAEVEGDHFTLIDPTSSAWLTVVRSLPALFGH